MTKSSTKIIKSWSDMRSFICVKVSSNFWIIMPPSLFGNSLWIGINFIFAWEQIFGLC
jgi:hypothetical protein